MDTDAKVIEEYLFETVKIGSAASKEYSKMLVEKGVDSVTVLQAMQREDLQKVMEDIGVKEIHQTLIIKSISPTISSPVSDDKKKEQVQEAKNEAERVRKEVEDKRDAISAETLTRLNEALEKVKTDGDWKIQLKTTDELLKDLDNVLQKLKIVEKSSTVGNYSNNAELLNSISSSAACKAIHFVNSSSFGDRGARALLDFSKYHNQYGDFPMTSSPSLSFKEEKFSSIEEYHLYENLRQSGGSSNAASVAIAGFYGGFVGAGSGSHASSQEKTTAKKDASKELISRVIQIKNAEVKINSFALSGGKYFLDDEALRELNAIKNVQQAKQFLREFGTHVLLTNQITGGVYSQKVDITFSNSVEEHQTEEALAEARKISASMIASYDFVGGLAGVATSSHSESSSFSRKLSNGETYSCFISFLTFGPQVSNWETFKTELGASNRTHCLVSNGFDPSKETTWAYKPIWSIVASQIPDNKECVKLLRDAWLSMVLNKENSLEDFMTSVVERCLDEALPDDPEYWDSEWRKKLEDCRYKPTIERPIIEKPRIITPYLGPKKTTYTNWEDGASKELIYIDRHNVKASYNSVLQGFHLNCDEWKIRYSIFSCEFLADYGKTVEIRNQEIWYTDWQDGGGKVLAYLDRHNIELGDNRVLTQFQLERHKNQIRYRYTSVQLFIDGIVVPLSEAQTHETDWQKGAYECKPSYLDRQYVCVPEGRVLTGFCVKCQEWQMRYVFTSRALRTVDVGPI